MFKKVLTTTVLGVSVLGAMAANAATTDNATSGIYITGQFGYANNHIEANTDTITLINNNLSTSNLAERIAIGYQFSQNFALEAGYFRINQNETTLSYYSPEGNINPDGKLSYNQNSIDLTAKGILPVTDNFHLYGKLGIAYLTTEGNISADNQSYKLNVAKRKFAPEAVVGMSYNITSNTFLDASLTYIHPIGNNKPGNINFTSVGIGYNFG